jgi:hypothetical protein
MSSDAVIAGLKQKRAELAAEHSDLLRRAAAVNDDIAALVRSISIFDPAQPPPDAPSRRGKRRGPSSMSELYARGDFQRDALEAIRTATGPITANGLVARLAAGKGLKLDDVVVRRGFEKRVSATLSGLKTRGILVNGVQDAEGRSTYAPAP